MHYVSHSIFVDNVDEPECACVATAPYDILIGRRIGIVLFGGDEVKARRLIEVTMSKIAKNFKDQDDVKVAINVTSTLSGLVKNMKCDLKATDFFAPVTDKTPLAMTLSKSL